MELNSTTQLELLLPPFIQLITGLGIQIEIGTDFSEFKNICRHTDGKGDVGPAFDVDEVQPESLNGFWIVGRRLNGEIVHTQAIKLITLSNSTLKQHVQQYAANLRVGGIDIDVAKSIWKLTPAAKSISGKVTYHGELWLKGGPGGARGGSAATLLTRLMLIVALLKWSPNYLIGIQAASTSCRGLATREGYMRTEQGSVLWKPKNGQPPIEGWLVWMNREEAEFNLQVAPDNLFNMLEVPARKVGAAASVLSSA